MIKTAEEHNAILIRARDRLEKRCEQRQNMLKSVAILAKQYKSGELELPLGEFLDLIIYFGEKKIM